MPAIPLPSIIDVLKISCWCSDDTHCGFSCVMEGITEGNQCGYAEEISEHIKHREILECRKLCCAFGYGYYATQLLGLLTVNITKPPQPIKHKFDVLADAVPNPFETPTEKVKIPFLDGAPAFWKVNLKFVHKLGIGMMVVTDEDLVELGTGNIHVLCISQSPSIRLENVSINRIHTVYFFFCDEITNLDSFNVTNVHRIDFCYCRGLEVARSLNSPNLHYLHYEFCESIKSLGTIPFNIDKLALYDCHKLADIKALGMEGSRCENLMIPQSLITRGHFETTPLNGVKNYKIALANETGGCSRYDDRVVLKGDGHHNESGFWGIFH